MAQDSSVGIATCYGTDGPGIECRWKQDLPYLSRPALRATQPPLRWVPGVKGPGRGVYHQPPSSAEVKERVEQNIYFPPEPLWPVLGQNYYYLYPHLCIPDPSDNRHTGLKNGQQIVDISSKWLEGS